MFDAGAEISCMNMDTCAGLGIMGHISEISVTINTASGQNMGMAGNVYVTFKIGKKNIVSHTDLLFVSISTDLLL